MKHLGRLIDEGLNRETGKVGAALVAVEGAIDVGAGVADHRDDVHGEFGAGRVLALRVLAREVRRDHRGGQAGVGHETLADGVAEVDNAGWRDLDGLDHRAGTLVRLLHDGEVRQLDLRDQCEPEVLHEQARNVGVRRRQVETEAVRRQVPSVRELDAGVKVGAVLGHVS